MFFTASETANSVPAEEKAHLHEIMKIEFHPPFSAEKTGYFIFTTVSRWVKSIRLRNRVHFAASI
jgi:hypothetical protein